MDGRPLVVRHTFGLTHAPHPEDRPIMPVDYTGFKLRPFGFFDRDPTLDVPLNAEAARPGVRTAAPVAQRIRLPSVTADSSRHPRHPEVPGRPPASDVRRPARARWCDWCPEP
ncbi:hypothetical protein [Streptomyces iconiensis]|uniref:copper amine oxidase n=1 Tax=Streptomyces iconiensis TaxID=1384038 RepID=UPI00321BC792